VTRKSQRSGTRAEITNRGEEKEATFNRSGDQRIEKFINHGRKTKRRFPRFFWGENIYWIMVQAVFGQKEGLIRSGDEGLKRASST